MQSLAELERHSIQTALARADHGGIYQPSTKRSYLIFCVGQEEDKIRSFMRFSLKTGLGFKPLQGCYKGVRERSFIVNTVDFDLIRPFIMDEESILLLHDYNTRDVPRAMLVFPYGTREPLGYFVQGTEEVVEHYDSWTFDPMTGYYYVASP